MTEKKGQVEKDQRIKESTEQDQVKHSTSEYCFSFSAINRGYVDHLKEAIIIVVCGVNATVNLTGTNGHLRTLKHILFCLKNSMNLLKNSTTLK